MKPLISIKRLLLASIALSAFVAAVRCAYRLDVVAMVLLLAVAGAAVAWAVRP